MKIGFSRENYFTPECQSETPWNILLDLFMAATDQKHISLSSACITSGAPQTAALRCIALMNGMIERCPNPSDNRARYLTVSDDAFVTLSLWLELTLDEINKLACPGIELPQARFCDSIFASDGLGFPATSNAAVTLTR